MAGVSGINFLLKVNTGTSGSPVYTSVGGQRGATLNLGMSPIDTTSKDSANWEEHVAGNRNWSIDADALILESDTGYAELIDWYFNNTQLQVEILTAGSHTFIGLASVTSLPHDMPHDGEATFSVTLQGSGALVYT